MKVLAVGRGGQVARALARVAPTMGVEVVAVGRPELELGAAGARQRLPEVVAQYRADAIVNVAAYTAVDKAETEPTEAFAVNAAGAADVAAAAKTCGARLIHVSTDYVFSGSKREPYVETDATAPTTIYGASKLEGEGLVVSENSAAVIARTSWVFSSTGSNFVRTMLRLASTRSAIKVVADQKGCPTSADQLAHALLAMAAARPTGIFHCAGSGEATWASLARKTFLLSRERGGPWAEVEEIATADYPTPAKRPIDSRLNCEKLNASFGIRLPHWHDGLAECIDQIAAAGWNVE